MPSIIVISLIAAVVLAQFPLIELDKGTDAYEEPPYIIFIKPIKSFTGFERLAIHMVTYIGTGC